MNQVYAVISSMTSFYLPLPVMFYVYFRILLIAKNQVKGIRQLQMSLEQNGHLGSQLGHLNEVGADFVSMTDLSSSRRDTRDASNIHADTTTHGCIILSPATESPNNNQTTNENETNTNTSVNASHSIQASQLFVKGSFFHKKDNHHSFANAMESLGLKRLSATSTSTTSNQGNVVVPSLVVDPAARSVERSLRRRSRQLVTDTKAIRTLGIVMGVFCACW